MRKMFEEDLSLSEIKSMIKGLHKKKNFSCILLGALGVLLLLAIIVCVVSKTRCCCDDSFDDFDYDDDDFESDEDDFEN